MIRHTVWACTVIWALLLVLPASASTTSTDRSIAMTGLQPGSRPGAGVQPAPLPDPGPICGTGPGDDDTPNRGGVAPPSRDTIGAVDGRKPWSLRDWSAWFQRHVLYILRAKR